MTALSVLQLDLSLAPPIIDLLLGGHGKAGVTRELTDIEESIVTSVVELICRLAGSGVRPDIRGSGTPSGEIDRQWVDFSKLRGLTGWAPHVPLEDGLRRTIAWQRAHGA